MLPWVARFRVLLDFPARSAHELSPTVPSTSVAGDLATNLRSGLRLALLRRPDVEDFRCGVDQLVALVMLNLAVDLLADYLVLPAPRAFNLAGLRASGFILAMDLLAAYVVARVLSRPSLATPLLVVLFSVGPVAHIVGAIVESAGSLTPKAPRLLATYFAVSLAVTTWALVICYRAIRVVAGREDRRLWIAYFLYLAIVLPPAFLPRERFWQPPDDEEEEGSATGTPERAPAVTWKEGEELLNAQPGMVRGQDEKLLPERKGIVDLYFVGFASYADQDVFLKEITYARDLFDDRFDTRGRSLLLVNNRQTKRTLPVASVTNLRATLRDVGNTMNRAEDVLFLFLASHGGRDHTLSVRNGYLPLRELTGEILSDALRQARIKWRVIVVDACYSGGFIAPLKDESTIVLTSASANHTSYGCGDDSEMTYFGKAFLRHGLYRSHSFTDSFAEAASLIHRWETNDERSHSEPQIFVGPAIAERVKLLDARLERASANGRRSSRQ